MRDVQGCFLFLQDFSVDSQARREFAEKEDRLQKQIIQLSEENIELKFEVEQARKDIPRLKVLCADTHPQHTQTHTMRTRTVIHPCDTSQFVC